MKHNWLKNKEGEVDTSAFCVGTHNGVVCIDCGEEVCIHCVDNWQELDDCVGRPTVYNTPLKPSDRFYVLIIEEPVAKTSSEIGRKYYTGDWYEISEKVAKVFKRLGYNVRKVCGLTGSIGSVE